MSTIEILPLQPHEFDSLPAGFEYPHHISKKSNTSACESAVDRRDGKCCVVCGEQSPLESHPSVQSTFVIKKCCNILWERLKTTGFVPPSAKRIGYEPRSSISLCLNHRNDFLDYHFFIRWVPSVSAFIFVNFGHLDDLEKFHGKKVVLDPNHPHSPFRAPFLIHEMRARGSFPWCTDRAIPYPSSPTHTVDIKVQPDPRATQMMEYFSESGIGSRPALASMGAKGTDGSLALRNTFPEAMKWIAEESKRRPTWQAANMEGWDDLDENHEMSLREENVTTYVNSREYFRSSPCASRN